METSETIAISRDVCQSNLPKGWTDASVLGLASLIRGVSYAKGEARSSPGSGRVALLRANNIRDGLVFDDLQHVPESRVNQEQRLRVGDVVLAMSSGSKSVVGKAASIQQPWDGTFGAFCGVLRPHPGFDNRYFGLYFQTKEYRTAISEASAGTNINNLKREYFEALRVPLAPLAEQKRIVAKVEVLLARVNAARERLAKVPAILKRFRQSVLAAACSGQLTAEWLETQETTDSARILLSEIGANEVAAPDEAVALPEPWAWASLGSLTVNHDAKRIPVKADDRAKRRGEYPYYGASGVIDSIDDFLFDGDYLLIAEDGANLLARSTPIAFRASGRFWVNNHAHVVTTKGGIPLEYVEIFLNSLDLQHYVTGTAQPKLTRGALNGIAVPVAPVTEQREIVRRVEALFTLADKIETRVQAATARVEKITQAVLAKAFRGELVPTEAELARQEGRDYEPASVLLERIRAARAAARPSTTKRRTRRTQGRRNG